MFRSITINPPTRPGKYADEKSLWGKANHYAVGNDNEFIGATTTTKNAFPDWGVCQRRAEIRQPPVSVCLGSASINYTSNI